MKKWKKQVVLFAAIVFAIFIAPQWRIAVSAANGDIASGTSNNITWVIDANGKLTISGSGDFSRSGENRDEAPWYSYRENIKSAVVNVTGMTDASDLFRDCTNLVNVDLSGFDTSSVTDMRLMFEYCGSLTSLDVSGFDTSQVTDMYAMFRGCSGLISLDVKNFNTSKVTDMLAMFSFCSNLTSLDLSTFDTSNVTDMCNMFFECKGLTNLDLSNFDTSNVTDMADMFPGCNNLTNLDVSHFDTSNVTNMTSMFNFCSNLTSLNVSSFDTSNVTDMSTMFANCNNLKSLDISHFNTSKATDMYAMFYKCRSLTSLDLSSFDTSKVTKTEKMLSDCDNLSIIYSPYNMKMSTALPGTGWQLPDGTKITELPQNLDHSVTITRKSTDAGPVEDESGQTGTDSGVLEGTGSSADSAVYGKRLLTAKPTDFKTILLSWEAAPNAKSYEIFYSTSPTGGFQRLANVKKTSYKFSKAKCGVTYYFQMRVCEKKAKSEFGPVSYAKTDLTGATTLQVKKTTYNSVQLKWNKIPGAKKYEIFYADSMDGSWQSLGVRGGTSFTHKKLVTGATYYYQVRPVRDSFRGSWSNGVSATTALGDVAGLKAKAAGSDRMKLSWKKVRGATQYVILRSESIDGTYETIGRSGRASYMDTGLPGGTTYFYKVYAVSGPYKTKETAPVGQTTRISR